MANDEQGAPLILDGKRLGWARASYSWLVFSPDSRHLACVGRFARGQRILCDGRKGVRYDRVRSPAFSPDGRHLCYLASRGGDWFVVCDGVEGPPHDEVWLVGGYRGGNRTPPDPMGSNRKTARSLCFTGTLRYYAIDDGVLRLVEVDWPKDRDWTNGLKLIEPPKEE